MVNWCSVMHGWSMMDLGTHESKENKENVIPEEHDGVGHGEPEES